MSLQADTTVAYNIVTSSAVIIGGVWAYFKFVRGRIFANRAELNVSTSVEACPGRLYLCVTVAFKNTGLSRLTLNGNMKAIKIFHIADQPNDGLRDTVWERITTLPILDQHEWIEAQESVTDTLVFQLPMQSQHDAHRAAYQVEAIVGARPRPITRKRVRWRARTVTFLPGPYSTDLPSTIAMTNPTKKVSLIQRIISLGKG